MTQTLFFFHLLLLKNSANDNYHLFHLIMLLLFSNLWRTTSEEKRELERIQKPMYNSVRRAAEVHRQVQNILLFFCSFVLIVYVVWYNSTIYNIGLLGAEIHEEHCEAWNVDD